MKYILIEFTFGLKGQGYQAIQNGEMIGIVDLTGKAIEFEGAIEYKVVNGKELDAI